MNARPGIPKREQGLEEKRKLAAHVPTFVLKHPPMAGRARSTSTRNFQIPSGGLANETAPSKKYSSALLSAELANTRSENDPVGRSPDSIGNSSFRKGIKRVSAANENHPLSRENEFYGARRRNLNICTRSNFINPSEYFDRV